jgi:hypothetical protein
LHCDEDETLEIRARLGAWGADIWEEWELRVLSDSVAEHPFCGVEGVYRIVERIIGAYINFISTQRYLQMEYLPSLISPIGTSDMKGLAVKIWLAFADGGCVQNTPDSDFLSTKPFTQKVKQNPAVAAETPRFYAPMTSSQERQSQYSSL